MQNYVFLVYEDTKEVSASSFIRFASLDKSKAIDVLAELKENDPYKFSGTKYYLRSVPLGKRMPNRETT